MRPASLCCAAPPPKPPRGPRAPAGGRAGIKGGPRGAARTAGLGPRTSALGAPPCGRAGAAAPTPDPGRAGSGGDARPLCVGLLGGGRGPGPRGRWPCRADPAAATASPSPPGAPPRPCPFGWPVCRRVPAPAGGSGAAGAATGVWPRAIRRGRAGGGQVSPAAVGQRRVLPGAHYPGSQTTAAWVLQTFPSPGHAESSHLLPPILPSGGAPSSPALSWAPSSGPPANSWTIRS